MDGQGRLEHGVETRFGDQRVRQFAEEQFDEGGNAMNVLHYPRLICQTRRTLTGVEQHSEKFLISGDDSSSLKDTFFNKKRRKFRHVYRFSPEAANVIFPSTECQFSFEEKMYRKEAIKVRPPNLPREAFVGKIQKRKMLKYCRKKGKL